jgi:hypothetical protein
MLPGYGRFGASGVGGGGAALDPYFRHVVLLLGADGANGSTTFTDESNSAHTVTANGNAQISTAQAKFGTSSILLDGTGDYLSSASSPDWDLGPANYTFELWCRPTFGAGIDAQELFCVNNTLRAYLAANDFAARLTMAAPSTASTAADAVDTALWQHLVVERYQDIGRVYVDGVMAGKSTGSTVFAAAPTDPMRIGAYLDGLGNLNGYIQEVRLTYGIARYNSDSGYTVPTAPFPRAQGAESGDYRYWKIRFTVGNDPNAIIFREIDVKESISGTDVSQCARISGTVGFFSPAEEARFTADGSTSTFWQPGIASGAEIVYDFITKRTLHEMTLDPHPDFFGRTPQNVEVLGSNDGSSYTSIQSWTGFSSWTGSRTLNW